MALLPHSHFPRSMFDMDKWFQQNVPGISTLDSFDPFDELDHTIARNMQWLNKPEFMPMMPVMPRVPQKYRVIVDCVGYKPASIKTEISGNDLVVTGHEEVKEEKGDFHVKEFKKTYRLPENAEKDKLVSFMTHHGELVIEVPLRESQFHMNQDLLPKIVDGPNGCKQVELNFTVPEKIHPEHIHVSVKDRDLIVKAEEKVEKPDGVSRFYYYKRTTLPENTDFKHLKCNYDNHKIAICAPLDMDFRSHKKVPIEFRKH
jgi:HSP20 family molecular chaperone IbpA